MVAVFVSIQQAKIGMFDEELVLSKPNYRVLQKFLNDTKQAIKVKGVWPSNVPRYVYARVMTMISLIIVRVECEAAGNRQQQSIYIFSNIHKKQSSAS